MSDDFRVRFTEIPNLPGLQARVMVELGGAVFYVDCPPQDVDPPEYVRLKQIAAQHRVNDLESELTMLKGREAAIEGLLETLRPVADPAGEHKKQVEEILYAEAGE